MAKQSTIQNVKEVKNMKDNVVETKECLQEIIIGRRMFLIMLSELRTELNKLATDVRICKISGGVGGVVGTGMVIGGFVASFFTFGASLIVSAVGAGIGAAGAVTATGASIADTVISKKKRKIINGLLEDDARLVKELGTCCENLKLSFDFFNLTKSVASSLKTIVGNAIRISRVVDVATDVSRTAFGVLRGSAKAFAIAGVVFSIISLPFDIHMVISNSINHHKGNKHKIIEEFEQFEDDIRKELVSMEDMMRELENTQSTIETL